MNIKIEYEGGIVIIHADRWDGNDYTLCGFDTSGGCMDGYESYGPGISTNKKITCEQCLAIINHCKKYKKTGYKK